MKKTIQGAVKSKAIWLSILVLVLTTALEWLPQMKVILGDYVGVAGYTLTVLIALIRVLTTESLEDKAK